MPRLVVLRHGQSTWNLTNQFAGWCDVPLSDQGRLEARQAARLLADAGLGFDRGYASYLSRSVNTLNLVLDELGLHWLPVETSWRLNERHYGALQGLDKTQVLDQYGPEQFKLWRRSWAVPPPPLGVSSPFHGGTDRRYDLLAPAERPAAESLRQAMDRFLPYWSIELVPRLRAGERLLVVAHGSTLRGLLKHLRHLSDDEITGIDVPNAVPLVIDLDDELRFRGQSYLGDPAEVEAKVRAVARQGLPPPATEKSATMEP